MNSSNETSIKGSGACRWAIRLAGSGLLFVIAGLLLPRVGLSPLLGMLLMTVGTLVLIISGITSGIGLLRSGGTAAGSSPLLTWGALALGAAALLNTGVFMSSGGGAPIHDISTDTVNPPEFVAVAELRGPDDNPAEYAGAETAAVQAEAYPDLQTLILLDPPSFVFQTALEVAGDMGWEIVASNASAGTIEATATTPFAGFKDDVVIRVKAVSAETHVDVRSKSRIGRGDMGVNAARIRQFIERLVTATNP